ncbi:MAG: hypothetical protein VKK62_04200 [Synechococcaceae cyanobacterium]|nr:hypothetical protein [Synechococcaceae cyanobacterium]
MTFSGIWENFQERISPLRSQLFPREVLIELTDEGLRGQLFRNDRPEPVSLEAPLPPLTCKDGMPLEPEPLGDMIGDLLVRDKLLDTHVMAALPPVAVQFRVIAWPDGEDLPDDPSQALRRLNPDLTLPFSLSEACFDLLPLAGVESRSLLAASPRRLVEGWIEVFNFAGAQLERLAPAQSCQLAALEGVLQACPEDELVALLDVRPEGVRLMLIREGVPRFERALEPDRSLMAQDLERCLRFYRRQDPAAEGLRLLLTAPLPDVELVEESLGVGAELLDHGPYGSLVLQGLAIHDRTP